MTFDRRAKLFGIGLRAQRFGVGLRPQHMFCLGLGDFGRAAGQRQLPHRMFQLSHIAGPLIVGKDFRCPFGQGARRGIAGFGPFKEMRGKQGNIIHAVAQRGHMQRRPRETIIQIAPQGPRLHRGGQIRLAGGKEPRRMFAGRVHHACDTGLNLFREIADLVNQQRPAADPRQDTCRAFKVLQLGRGDGDKGQVPPVRKIVDRLADQRLSCAGFAPDQHRQIRVHHPRHHAVERLHHRRAPHQRQIIPIPIAVRAGLRRTARRPAAL